MANKLAAHPRAKDIACDFKERIRLKKLKLLSLSLSILSSSSFPSRMAFLYSGIDFDGDMPTDSNSVRLAADNNSLYSKYFFCKFAFTHIYTIPPPRSIVIY